MIDKIDLEALKKLLEESFRCLYQLDTELFDYKTENRAVSERCIVFRLGWYLQALLQTYDTFKTFKVDAEYNRCFDHPKSMYKETLEGIRVKIGDAIPDLIIHKRKSNTQNLAIFEFKKAGSYAKSGRDEDFKKLEYFTDPNNEYKFKYGFWIVLYKKKVDVHIFQRGEEKSHLKYTWEAEKQICKDG